MAKDRSKIKFFFAFFLHNLLIISAQDIIETNELARSFIFAAVINTSSSLNSEDQILARHEARSAVACAHKCLTNKQCQVIGFNAKEGECWLMKSAGRNGEWKPQDTLILTKVRFTSDEKLPDPVEEFSSCKDVLDKGRSKGNGVYNIKTNQATTTKTYCHMDKLSNCGGGGWTLTMKIDGSEDTFDFNSSYWTNRQHLDPEDGLGLEEQETKLQTYWSIPLTKICLGMKMKTSPTMNTKWLKLELKQRAASLYDVITIGNPTQPYTLLGASKWKDTFVPSARYRIRKSSEGVNITLNDMTSRVRARLGVACLVGENSRLTYLGFGTWASWHRKYGKEVSCGYGRKTGSRQYYVAHPAFCYILVQ